MAAQEWHPTSTVHMSVQSAELHLRGFKSTTELYLTCSLVNIARGHSVVHIRPLPGDSIAATGKVDIPVDRPVMRLDVEIAAPAFARLRDGLQFTPPRPVTLVALLADPLMVTTAGDLMIDQAITSEIVDLSWILPLH
jgi:hypothetical protein